MFPRVLSCNIVIIPPEEIRQIAIDVSRKIAAHGSDLVLSEESAIPHITIHQFAFPVENIVAVDSVMERTFWGKKPLELTLSGVSEYPGNAIFWNVNMTDALLGIHRQLVKDINELRQDFITGLHSGCLTGEVDIGAARRKNLAKWGNPLTMDTFVPHITLSVLPEADLLPMAMEIASELGDISWQSNLVFMATLGPRGTCPGMPEKSFSLDS